MTIALWLQVEQLNREIARAWEGLRQQPGGLHCVDMLVRKPLPLNSRPKPASVLLDCSCHCSCSPREPADRLRDCHTRTETLIVTACDLHC